MDTNQPSKQKGLLSGEPANIAELISYQDGTIVSREILKKPSGNVTLFAIDAGLSLSEHTSPYDALAYVLEGLAEVKVDGDVHQVGAGQVILLPANHPHALFATQSFKMMLTMLRPS